MKTNNIKIIITLLLTFNFFSCTKLDEDVFDQVEADRFYENFGEADVVAAMGPVYSNMRNLYSGYSAHLNGSWLYTGEEATDIQVTPSRGGAWYDGGLYYKIHQQNWSPDHAHFLGNWRAFYGGVNTCNRLLYQFADKEFANKEQVLAELRTARAFWYSLLIDFFGNVPLVTEFKLPEGFLPETRPRKEVFDFIVKELEESNDKLAETGYGRWNKYAAKHLLARVYLNAEVWSGAPQWDKVISLTDEIMASGKYTLESDYKNPFVTNNEGSKEIVFAVGNDEKYHNDNPFLVHMWSHHWKAHFHFKTETYFWGGMCAPPEFIDSYDPQDLRLAKSWYSGQLYDNLGDGSALKTDPWRPGDAGKNLVYTKEFTEIAGQPGVGEHEGYRMFKYEIKEGARASLSNDFVLFRYADVYFMKAEALWRKNGKVATGEVVELINTVRKRAFVNFDNSEMLKVGDLNDNRFLMEYAWEFCQEGHRRQQLIRFGQFTTKTWVFKPAATEPFRVLFPIPHQELLANPKLVQNPGY